MKLISCYIENFGCLHQYSLEFRDGITTVHEANGFGKTTLAEFLRSMFYGLPRKSKSLQKDLRSKYMPWQGGKFGGNLIFEHGGTVYKIERSFGSVPRQDSFSLYNQDTGRKSSDFSENIGVELFQLDADSFERSTYLPQMREFGCLTTDNIQAKLGDLVDDTNDINNYEKAIAALRTKRSSLIPYRGDSGTVAKAHQKITALQQELAGLSDAPDMLDQARETLGQLNDRTANKTAARETIRKEITAASEAAARQTVQNQLEALREKLDEDRGAEKDLKQKYPQGLPTPQILDRAETIFADAQSLEGQNFETDSLMSARETAEQNRDRFSSGVPTEDDFRRNRELLSTCVSLEGQLAHSSISDAEMERYQALSPLFPEGAEEIHRQLQQKLQDLQNAQVRLTHSGFSEVQQLSQLEEFFHGQIPDPRELETQKENLQKAETLKQENLRLASLTSEVSAAPKPRKTGALILLVLGILGLIAGLALIPFSWYLPAAVCCILGLGALIGAIYLNLRQMVTKSDSQAMNPETRLQIDRNQEQIRELESQVLGFTARYISDDTSLAQGLAQISGKAEMLQTLLHQKQDADLKQEQCRLEVSNLTDALTEALAPYGLPEGADFPQALELLREQLQFCRSLSQRISRQETQAETIRQELEKNRKLLREFLKKYSMEEGHPDESLTLLQQSAAGYEAAEKLLEEAETRKSHTAQQLQQLEKELKELVSPYHLTLSMGDRQSLQDLRSAVALSSGLQHRILEEQKAVDSFREEHKAILSSPMPENIKDSDSLKAAEHQLSLELSELSEAITETKQKIRNLEPQVEEIPRKQDHLQSLQIQMAEDQKRAALLDQTMAYLEQARDALSHNYLGTLQQRFCGYLERITGHTSSEVSVNGDLEVQLERMGENRELGYFSAGQNDLVVLSMRLALVDTLFGNTRPFLILDDPFINLDDEHTERALQLLEDLGQDHQILYLCCNSSRSL